MTDDDPTWVLPRRYYRDPPPSFHPAPQEEPMRNPFKFTITNQSTPPSPPTRYVSCKTEKELARGRWIAPILLVDGLPVVDLSRKQQTTWSYSGHGAWTSQPVTFVGYGTYIGFATIDDDEVILREGFLSRQQYMGEKDDYHHEPTFTLTTTYTP